MNSLTKFFKKEMQFKGENMTQHLLSVLFVIYLIMGYTTPEPLASAIDSLFGKVVVIVIALALFSISNPVLGVLGLLVAFDLIRRSARATGTYALSKFMPTEEKKTTQLTAYNQFPYTLEQEVVKKMAPLNYTSSNSTQVNFMPILENNYDAAPLDYNGII